MIKIYSSIILYIISLSSNAITLNYDDLKIHVNGYAGYKYIASSTHNHAIESEPELGLELSLDINDNWSAYTQFQYDEDINNALTYSFLTYQNNFQTDDFMLRVNAGKLRHDVALYNNTRVNPRTRQGVIVPQSIYWDSLKHLLTSGDGINLSLKFKNLEVGYTIDQPIVTDAKEEARVWTGQLLQQIDTYFGSHQLANIKYSFDFVPLVLKASWSRIDLGGKNTQLMQYVFPEYKDSHQIVEFLNAGFIINYDKWTLSSETIVVKPFYTGWFTGKDSYGMSVTVNREITENISVYMNYNQYETATKSVYSWYPYAKDMNIGINYHQSDWMIGAEVHRINGGRWVLPHDFANNPDDFKEWWIVGINAVYFF